MDGEPDVDEDTRVLGASWLQLAVTLLLLGILGTACLFSGDFRGEVSEPGGRGTRERRCLGSEGLYPLLWGMGARCLDGPYSLAGPGRVRDVIFSGLANGLAYGAIWGGLLSIASAGLAAAIAFGIARAVGRVPVEALVRKRSLGTADRWFARNGTYAVLAAQLIPVVSFDAISYVAGLTRMNFWRFLLATTIGMTPASFAYAYLGEQAPGNINLLLAAFGIFVTGVVVLAVARRRRGKKLVP